MDEFKLVNFERVHGVPFPTVERLAPAQCDAIVEKLRKQLGLPASANRLDVVHALDSVEVYVPSVSASDTSFDILSLFPASQISKSVLLNWYRFDDIDRIDLATVASFFSDIWYPASDDIDMFDEELSWVISIRHDGAVKRVMF